MTRALLVTLAGAAVLIADRASARPGGGHSYSGGSHSSSSSFSRSSSHSSSHSSSGYRGSSYSGSSSSYSDGDLDLFAVLFAMYPEFGIPFLLMIGFALYSHIRKSGTSSGWTSGSPRSGDEGPWAQSIDVSRPPPPPLRNRLSALRHVGPPGQGPFDPNFSLVLFEDFVYALYAKVQQARAGRLGDIAPWVTGDARRVLARNPVPLRVDNVVIGAMKFLRVSNIDPAIEWVRVTLEFEANFTELLPDGTEQAYYVVDRWRLSRRSSAKSRPPERIRTFDCPNCGTAMTEIRGVVCAHCGTNIGAGQFDWVVDAIELVRKDARGPQLTGDVEEVGTDLPTVVAPNAHQALSRLEQEDPTFQWSAFEERVRLVFREMYAAWSSRDWLKARPYLSDNLFQMQSYWVDAYKRAGLTNQLTAVNVSGVELANVVRDPYFDAITVRVRASGFDYTVSDESGEIVSGSADREREWTEYWTFIRGVGVKRPVTTEQKCPNCGAPLNINMAGNCEYCQARVTSGAFDWVLSRIEQDESYGG